MLPPSKKLLFDICNTKELVLKNGCRVARSSGPVAAGFLLGVGVYSAVDLICGRITTRSISDRIDKSIIEW